MRLLDLALLLMVVIWGANFSVIKFALREFPQITFNALRLSLSSTVFLIAIWIMKRENALPVITRAEWRRIIALGLIGHLLYQLAFVAGVARTSAGNSALIFGTTPIAVALMASVAGHERLTWPRWAAAALSLLGIYFVVGRRATWSRETLLGDALVFVGMLCWSLYSTVAQPLLRKHSPLVITGFSMAIGAGCYVVIAIPSLLTTNWSAISITSWVLMAMSSLLALAFAYMIWYTGVQRIGSSRTAIYSNLTPIVAMIVAYLWLGESIDGTQIIGAITILSGVFVTRLVPAKAAA